MSDPLEAAKREQERTTEALLDAKRQLTEAMNAKAGPPAEDEDEAQEQLRSIRASIERDIESLRRRVPDAGEVVDRARPIAIAVGGGLGALYALSRGRSRRRGRKHHERELNEQATALARQFARLDLEAIAAEAAAERTAEEERGGGKGKLVVLALVVLGAAVAAWARARTREEPDVWGPGPAGTGVPPASEPLSTGRPAGAADITTEVPTIPVEDPQVRRD